MNTTNDKTINIDHNKYNFRSMVLHQYSSEPTLLTNDDASHQHALKKSYSMSSGRNVNKSSEHKSAITATPSPSGEDCGWKAPVLTKLGAYHCLEPRQHISVVFEVQSNDNQNTDEHLQALLDRLETTFADLSLNVLSYNDSPVEATCMCLEGAEFVVSVRLPRKKSTVSAGPEFVVQVQPTAGNTAIVAKYTRAILQAAEHSTRRGFDASSYAGHITTNATTTSFLKAKTVCDHLDTRSECPKTMTEAPKPQQLPDLPDTDAIMNVVIQLLSQVPTCCAGFELLCQLTDPIKTMPMVALDVSHILVLGRRMCNSSSNASYAKALQQLVLKRWAVDDGSAESYWALVAWTQSLLLLDEYYNSANSQQQPNQKQLMASEIMYVVDQASQWMNSDLVQDVILKRVVLPQASSHPHVAYYSLLALTALMKLLPSHSGKQTMVVQSRNVIEQCGQYVGRYHAAVGEASSKLLITLQACC